MSAVWIWQKIRASTHSITGVACNANTLRKTAAIYIAERVGAGVLNQGFQAIPRGAANEFDRPDPDVGKLEWVASERTFHVASAVEITNITLTRSQVKNLCTAAGPARTSCNRARVKCQLTIPERFASYKDREGD